MGFFDRKKKKSGWVYGLDSTRSGGSKKVYTGKTSNLKKRWGQHIRDVKRGNKKTWVGRGTYAKPIGAVWSTNRHKAERTIKKIPSEQKRSFFKSAARKRKKAW